LGARASNTSSEVARAIRQSASHKATGPDDVPAKLFEAGGEITLNRMQKICVAIWETGEWPEELTFSTFIPLPKKGDLNQCENYSVFQKKLDPLLFHHNCFGSCELHENFAKYTRDVACCEYGINVYYSLAILC